jgi:putative membrane protein
LITGADLEKGWNRMMGQFGYYGMGWIGMILGFALEVAVIVGLVVLVIWAIRRISGNSGQASPTNTTGTTPPMSTVGPTPKDIAQTRYAKGEITREEYQQIIADLSATEGPK